MWRAIRLLALCVSACATPAAEPQPALLDVQARHHVGTLWSGPLPLPPAVELEESQAWIVELRWVWLEDLPPGLGAPLSAAARKIVVEGAREMLPLSSELVAGARQLDRAPRLSGARWKARWTEALWPGTTAVFRAVPDPDARPAPDPPWEALELSLSRRDASAPRAELAVGFEGWVRERPPVDELGETSAPPGAPVLRHEQVVLGELGPAPEDALWIALPAPAEREPRGAYLVELRLSAAAAPGTPEAGEQVDARVAAALERGRAIPAAWETPAVSGEVARWSQRDVHGALARAGDPRAALVFVAAESGAQLASELALVADPQALAECLELVLEAFDAAAVEPDDLQDIGWKVESRAARWLVDRAERPDAELEPELGALLLRHAGELGRYPDLVREALASSRSLAELGQRFEQENRIFLEDGHPSARVRAFDWLAARALAPSGYDPLAPAAERRAALRRAEDPGAEEAPGQGAAGAEADGAR